MRQILLTNCNNTQRKVIIFTLKNRLFRDYLSLGLHFFKRLLSPLYHLSDDKNNAFRVVKFEIAQKYL